MKGASGPREVLDGNDATFVVMAPSAREIVLTTPQPVTINRIMLRESISTHSERVEKHAVDAFVDEQWRPIVQSSIPYPDFWARS